MSGSVFVVFAALLFTSPAPFSIPTVAEACGATPLDVRFHSSADEVRAFLDACGSSGRAAYAQLQRADLLYPLVSGLFLASALASVARKVWARSTRWSAVVLLPALAMGFDYVENACAWSLLGSYPGDSYAVASLLGAASTAKQLASWASWLILIGLTIAVPITMLRGRRAAVP